MKGWYQVGSKLVFVQLLYVVHCIFRVARVVAPKKIALKGAEDDLAIAMEVINSLYVPRFTYSSISTIIVCLLGS